MNDKVIYLGEKLAEKEAIDNAFIERWLRSLLDGVENSNSSAEYLARRLYLFAPRHNLMVAT